MVFILFGIFVFDFWFLIPYCWFLNECVFILFVFCRKDYMLSA
ncbi:putative membrane protein [Vibrio parahaemolyticus VPCR-2010]|nr:putative membrane protein [Vibrio parahaemolyticus VPCR-2010]